MMVCSHAADSGQVDKTEGNRIPVERPDFKSGETRTARLVGSTPTPFRHCSDAGLSSAKANDVSALGACWHV